jgi:alanyl-tRNA synthetase
MQQHSGQHVLSAAFIRLFSMPTVSFHMGEEACSIDLDPPAIQPTQVEEVELFANQIIQENRPVEIRFVTQQTAQDLGLRKPPRTDKDELRLIDIQNFDLSACGGTHVANTGQIGSILLRKVEKVRQGSRVEFVCGQRAVRTARHDYLSLTEAAALFSGHIWDVPQQVKKSLEEIKGASKAREHLLAELAELEASRLLAETASQNQRKIVVRSYADRDLTFIRLLGQKITRMDPAAVALLGAGLGQASLVFAQTKGSPLDVGSLLKEIVAANGGKGGGSRDMAQGGLPSAELIESALAQAAAKVNS